MLICPMNFDIPSDDPTGDGRRAAHVKWDGKTIALGTFSAQEAAEKCNRAKALTKKWRTTMIPKPDVEWVKNTLERLNIRVVNDRPGRRKKRDISEVEQKVSSSGLAQPGYFDMPQNRENVYAGKMHAHHAHTMGMNPMNLDASYSAAGQGMSGQFPPSNDPSNLPDDIRYGYNQQRRLSNPVLSTLSNPSNVFNMRDNAVGQSGYQSSLGDYSMLRNTGDRHSSSQDQFSIGRGAYSGEQASRNLSNTSSSTQQQLSGLPFGSERHYEVLKEHHLNLLKELQETTTLMKMYHTNTQSPEQLGMNLGLGRNQGNFDPYGAMGNNPFMNQSSGQNQVSSFDQNWRMGQSQIFSPKLNPHQLSRGENINLARRDPQHLPQISPANQYTNATNRDATRAGMHSMSTAGMGRPDDYDLNEARQRVMADRKQGRHASDDPKRSENTALRGKMKDEMLDKAGEQGRNPSR